MTPLISGAYYLLPDGTRVQAFLSVANHAREWQLVDVSGQPCYLLARDGRSFLRFVDDDQERGLIAAVCDLQLDDLHWLGIGDAR